MDLRDYRIQADKASVEGKVFCYCLVCRTTRDGHPLQLHVPKFVTRQTALRHKKDASKWPNRQVPDQSFDHPLEWFYKVNTELNKASSPAAAPTAGLADDQMDRQDPTTDQTEPPIAKRRRTQNEASTEPAPQPADPDSEPPDIPARLLDPQQTPAHVDQAPPSVIDQQVQDRAWGKAARLWHNKMMIGQWASIDHSQPLDEDDARSRVPGMQDGATRILYARQLSTIDGDNEVSDENSGETWW